MKITERIQDFYYRNSSLCNVSLLLLWLLVNLLQAAFTELSNDEAYYWMYANNLDYGYFDHPPAVAVLIKAGSFLFGNELGVRFFTVLLSTGFVWFSWQLTDRKNFPLFFAMLCAVGVLEAYGFIAVPDVPLLFFTATFFVLYRRYLNRDHFWNGLLISLNIAALLYSKYHGLLILFFTLLSNPALFRRKRFYLVIGLSVLFYLPHIFWQIVHDYPSYQYHVLIKSQDPYKPMDTVVFLLGQLCVAGPLTGVLFFYTAFRYRPKTPLEKALKYTLVGVLVFFLLSTINAPVEANWTVVAFIPLLVLSYQYVSDRPSARKWAARLSVVSCIFFLFIRLNLASDLVPAVGSKLFPEFYGWRSWAGTIRSRVGTTPVVFANSYQKASKYSFYSGQTALSLNNIRYRSNQYDLWSIEDSLQGKRVFFVPNWEISGEGTHRFRTSKEIVHAVLIDNFRSYAKVTIATQQPRFTFPRGTTVRIPVRLTNHYPGPVRFDHNEQYPVWLVYCLFREETPDRQVNVLPLRDLVLKKTFATEIEMITPQAPGAYYLRISIQTGWLPPAINSRLIRMNIE
jgi:hypothetical protein